MDGGNGAEEEAAVRAGRQWGRGTGRWRQHPRCCGVNKHGENREPRGGLDLPTYKQAHASATPCQRIGPPHHASVAKPSLKTTLGGVLNGFAKMEGLKVRFYS